MKNIDEEKFDDVAADAFQCGVCKKWYSTSVMIDTPEEYYDKDCYFKLKTCSVCGMGSERLVEREFLSAFGHLFSKNVCSVCDRKSDKEISEISDTSEKYDESIFTN